VGLGFCFVAAGLVVGDCLLEVLEFCLDDVHA